MIPQQTQFLSSPTNDHMTEPLDLSVKDSSGCNSPCHQRPWLQTRQFGQIEALDLTVIAPIDDPTSPDGARDISYHSRSSTLVQPPIFAFQQFENLTLCDVTPTESNNNITLSKTECDFETEEKQFPPFFNNSSKAQSIYTDGVTKNDTTNKSVNKQELRPRKSKRKLKVPVRKLRKQTSELSYSINQESKNEERNSLVFNSLDQETKNHQHGELQKDSVNDPVNDSVLLNGLCDDKNLLCISQNERGNESVSKKPRVESSVLPFPYLINKTPEQELMKTGESFLQEGSCHEVAPKLPRCQECMQASLQESGKIINNLCRFNAFRKLRYSNKGHLATAGFLDPHIDVTEDDLRLWQPSPDNTPADLSKHMAKFLLHHVGDEFCKLLEQEEEAVLIDMSKDKTVAWKRLLPEVRELCDVCRTTLFNFHWTCRTCGFAVCIDCYKVSNGMLKMGSVVKPWLLCVSKRAHVQEKLMLTQIIAGDSLRQLGQRLHELRASLELQLQRDCSPPISNASTMCEEDFDETEKYKASFYKNLRGHLNQLAPNSGTTPNSSCPPKSKKSHADIVEEMILFVFDQAAKEDPRPEIDGEVTADIRFMARRYNQPQKKGEPLPTRVMTLTESEVLYPDLPHSWLCEGRLLKLSDPSHDGNYKIFQEQWKRGQPVLVSDVLKYLDSSLWQPDSFIKDFGDTKNDLVNCMTGHVIPNQYMCKFWEGFQYMSKMMRDEEGNPMLLKLKDWPPGEDFAEMLPSRFQDLMAAVPLGEYTKRTGQLNLPSRLPSCFARPDLGPKMYIAYGSAIHPMKGTTNLHLDISDAVNIMVYVDIPKDIDYEAYIEEAYRAVDEACFEMLTRRRVREKSEKPGALWHIYSARDAPKIRHMLTRVAMERQVRLGPHQDPIHDQSWYLDAPLRQRLYEEYGVRGYAIVQCLGDAIFIPAGAPHQVRNILNCIKVAEDFVSPENISHCLHLTQEFRKLSDFHTNHEDKLQIKNIIYHAVKDSLSVLAAPDI